MFYSLRLAHSLKDLLELSELSASLKRLGSYSLVPVPQTLKRELLLFLHLGPKSLDLLPTVESEQIVEPYLKYTIVFDSILQG